MSMLECTALSKNYGSVEALRSIDLTLESGRIVGLVGPNGSGKTTMIPGPQTKAIVSYLPDRDFLPQWMNLDELMTFYHDFFPDFNPAKAADMLDALGVSGRQPLGKMSKGTREKVQLIFTMSREAKVYLLDEPIAGVDPATRDYILRTILSNYSENALVLISTHLITDVEPILDEVVFLQKGTIELHENADALRERTGKSIDGYFREVYRCWGN